MRVLNLEEKNTAHMEAINKFTLMDDTFMTQVFSGDLECIEELLKIILKRNDLSVTKSVTQLTIGNLFGRFVRLDIYANDATGKQYSIKRVMGGRIFGASTDFYRYLICHLSSAGA